MERRAARWTVLAVGAVSALAFAGLGVAPSHAQNEAELYIVHGIPATPLDLEIDGESVGKKVKWAAVYGPFDVEAGEHSVKATASTDGEMVAESTVKVTAGSSTDVVVHLPGPGKSKPVMTAYKNDLSVTVSRVPEFLERMHALVQENCPDYEVVWYGHIGDGNLHMNILKPDGEKLADFEARCHGISEKAYELTEAMGGSISAEHGIGLLKQPWLGRVRSDAEIRLMRGIKATFDPAGIFNPGKLFPEG